MRKLLFYITLLFILSACTGAKSSHDAEENAITTATGISIAKGDGFTTVTILNPWQAGDVLQTYILVPRDTELPSNLPKGTVLRTPLKKVLVYSSVHGSAIKELGGLSSIQGVCDASYFNMPEIQSGLKSRTITDAGSSMSPSIEKIIALAPEAIILSPFQNAGYGSLESLGIPIIECADYMESFPLGRAEWIKFFGVLYGQEALADSIFNGVSQRYAEIKGKMASTKTHPKVISESVINGTWFVPGGDSYMAHLFTDAGASYPWSSQKTAGSLSLDMAQVLDKAHDADFWLLKSSDPSFSYSKLRAQNELNAQFDAFKNHNIYYCNTETTTLFQDFPFHPDVLLKEFSALFHPEAAEGYNLRYFKHLANE